MQPALRERCGEFLDLRGTILFEPKRKRHRDELCVLSARSHSRGLRHGANLMPTMTIEDVPDDLYEKLKKRAEERGRSIDHEVIVCLRDALQRPRVDAEAFLARLEALQRQITAPPPPDR